MEHSANTDTSYYVNIYNQIKNKQKEALASLIIQEEKRLIQEIKLKLEKWDGLSPISIVMKVSNKKQAIDLVAIITQKGIPCFYTYDDYDADYYLVVKDT